MISVFLLGLGIDITLRPHVEEVPQGPSRNMRYRSPARGYSAAARASGTREVSGIAKEKVAPAPGRLSTQISPPR